MFCWPNKVISSTIGTVEHNLFMGAGVMVLVLMLGNLRAGLIVASVISCLLMLFRGYPGRVFWYIEPLGNRALMFGLIVDGAVISGWKYDVLLMINSRIKCLIKSNGQTSNFIIIQNMSSAVFGRIYSHSICADIRLGWHWRQMFQ